MTRLPALVLIFSLVAVPASAQAEAPSRPLMKYGKWVLAAGAVAMNYLASQAHQRAEDRFHALEDSCLADHSLCDVNESGRYVNDNSELLFQQSLRYDRQARRWLFGGETALLGAAAMFVVELTRHAPKPDNIPFEPEARSLRYGTGVGVRIGF
jgi:hypothetical protein